MYFTLSVCVNAYVPDFVHLTLYSNVHSYIWELYPFFSVLCVRLKRRQEEGCMVGEGEGAEGETEGEGDPDREAEEAEGGTEDEETEPEPETSKLSMCGSVCSSPGSS